MKILLDECLPVDFRHHLPEYDVHTAEWDGLKSLKNGQLLQEAERAGYEVFLTVDKGIPHQQKSRPEKISILVVRSRTNQLEDLLPLIDTILTALKTIKPGEIAFAPLRP